MKSISNFQAKKAYTKYVMEFVPPLYIDEYWDYYIQLYDLKDDWNRFLEYFIKEKFTYVSFYEEYIRILTETINIISSLWGENQIQKYNELIQSITPQMPLIDVKTIPDGRYLNVDIHNAVDTALKYIGLWNDTYTGTYDIFKMLSNYHIFDNMKRLKFNVNDNMVEKQDYIYSLYSNVLLEKIYQSDHHKIRYLNENYELFGKSYGDSYFYKLTDDEIPQNILGDFNCGDISIHIDIFDSKSIDVFGNKLKLNIIRNQQGKISTLGLYNAKRKANISLYPFAMKLATGEELNEKDLAIGYEDQIFFHFDKSELQ